MQVNQNIRQFSRFSKVSTGSIIGGMAYGPQLKLLRGRLDLLVATPGRLLDHMERGKVDFSRLEILVLDEADRMLDMGFIDAVKEIAEATPKERQTLLFSATLEGRVLKVANQLLKKPESIALRLAIDVTSRSSSICTMQIAKRISKNFWSIIWRADSSLSHSCSPQQNEERSRLPRYCEERISRVPRCTVT